MCFPMVAPLVIFVVIFIGGMEFCYLEFCFNSVCWSCHLVPVDLSGDCIRVCVGTSSSLELSSRSGGS